MKEKYLVTLQAKMAELLEVKDGLKKAKDTSIQSWLASKPLTDELGKLKSTLESARNRAYMSNASISDLESQLEVVNMTIKSKMDEEVKAKELTEEITKAVNIARKEMEAIKQAKDEERGSRLNLKQIVRMKKQKLRTLQATLQATELESEAFRASAAEAVRHILNWESEDSSFHQLTREEYYALITKAKDEAALAEWRMSLFMKQKLAAEVNRNLALSRLKELGRKKRKQKKINEDENNIKDVAEEQQYPITEEAQFNKRTTSPEARARPTDKKKHNIKEGAEEQQYPIAEEAQFNNRTTTPEAVARPTDKKKQNAAKQKRRPRKAKHNGKKAGKKKKPSFLIQGRRFLVQSFRRLF